jgi:hypothetical protein
MTVVSSEQLDDHMNPTKKYQFVRNFFSDYKTTAEKRSNKSTEVLVNGIKSEPATL